VSGAEHYRKAEELIKRADLLVANQGFASVDDRRWRSTADLAAAQVHAMLALAAALGKDEPERRDGHGAEPDAEVKRLRAEAELLRADLVEARRNAHTARIDYQFARQRAERAESELALARERIARLESARKTPPPAPATYFDTDAVLRCGTCHGLVTSIRGRTWDEVNASRLRHTCTTG